MSKVLKGLIVSNELKACPFCGGEVTESRGENISTIECPKCDYELLLYTSKILDTWNSRPAEPKTMIAEGLKHFMVNHYAGQFVPELTGPIIDLITESYPNITFGEEDVNEVLCVLHHICEVEK